MLIPEETKQTEEYQDLKLAWEETVEALPATVESLAEGIKAFKEDSDIPALMKVCTAVINELAALVSSVLPDEVSVEAIKYLGALEDAVTGFDEAMEEFTDGNTTGAVEGLYSGIKLAVSGLLPQDVQDGETYTAVVGALDSVFKGLSETVLKYRQQLLQSQVCWKDWIGRERKRADQCPEHMQFDGSHWCTRGDSGAALVEAAVSRKKPKGAVAPACSDDSDFSEKKGSWCYKDCPYGSSSAGTRCKSMCMGDYPIASTLMCGKSPGTIGAAIKEMAVKTVRGLFMVASSLSGGSGLAESLPGTISSLKDLGTGFAHPKCPTLGK